MRACCTGYSDPRFFFCLKCNTKICEPCFVEANIAMTCFTVEIECPSCHVTVHKSIIYRMSIRNKELVMARKREIAFNEAIVSYQSRIARLSGDFRKIRKNEAGRVENVFGILGLAKPGTWSSWTLREKYTDKAVYMFKDFGTCPDKPGAIVAGYSTVFMRIIARLRAIFFMEITNSTIDSNQGHDIAYVYGYCKKHIEQVKCLADKIVPSLEPYRDALKQAIDEISLGIRMLIIIPEIDVPIINIFWDTEKDELCTEVTVSDACVKAIGLNYRNYIFI